MSRYHDWNKAFPEATKICIDRGIFGFSILAQRSLRMCQMVLFWVIGLSFMTFSLVNYSYDWNKTYAEVRKCFVPFDNSKSCNFFFQFLKQWFPKANFPRNNFMEKWLSWCSCEVWWTFHHRFWNRISASGRSLKLKLYTWKERMLCSYTYCHHFLSW